MRIILFTCLSLALLCDTSNALFAQSIQTPINHRVSEGGTFALEYEFGGTYNPDRPTIIVIADAQQFYVRKGRMDKIWLETFGGKLNVVGIIPRSGVESLRKQTLKENGEVDWVKAYELFQSFQFVHDIEFFRKKVLSEHKEVYMYGQSGGALLISEYLSAFPDTPIKRVFIAAVVNPMLEAELGICHDKFQEDFLDTCSDAGEILQGVLDNQKWEKDYIAALFQRQNFFVPRKELPEARYELLLRLARNDTVYVDSVSYIYQIKAIQNLLASEQGIPVRARIFEFIAPLLPILKASENDFYPDLINSHTIAHPFIQAQEASEQVFQPGFQAQEAQRFKGHIFVLSGRYDHIADYRSSIYLSALFQNSTLFIADDDHVFSAMKIDKAYQKLVQEFFINDLSNTSWLDQFNTSRWSEF